MAALAGAASAAVGYGEEVTATGASPTWEGAAGPEGTGATGGARSAEDLGHEARQRAGSYIEDQKTALARQIGGLAQALHGTAQQLRTEDGDMFARYAERVAGGLDQVARGLRRRDVGSLAGDVGDTTRRHPAAMAGGAVLAGFLFARFLRSSHDHRPDERIGERDTGVGL